MTFRWCVHCEHCPNVTNLKVKLALFSCLMWVIINTKIFFLLYYIFQSFCSVIPLLFLSFLPSFFLSYIRRWGRGWGWRKAAILFWLCHALPDCVLEGSVRLCPTHGLLERLGMFFCFHNHHRSFDGCDWGPGQSFWLHYWPEGLCHCCGVCSLGNISPRWVYAFICPCNTFYYFIDMSFFNFLP